MAQLMLLDVHFGRGIEWFHTDSGIQHWTTVRKLDLRITAEFRTAPESGTLLKARSAKLPPPNLGLRKGKVTCV